MLPKNCKQQTDCRKYTLDSPRRNTETRVTFVSKYTRSFPELLKNILNFIAFVFCSGALTVYF